MNFHQFFEKNTDFICMNLKHNRFYNTQFHDCVFFGCNFENSNFKNLSIYKRYSR